MNVGDLYLTTSYVVAWSTDRLTAVPLVPGELVTICDPDAHGGALVLVGVLPLWIAGHYLPTLSLVQAAP